MTPAGSSVVLAVASSSFIPRLPRQHLVPASNLVDWMMRFQFDGDVDYLAIDPVAYAPALGTSGMAGYRARLLAQERFEELICLAEVLKPSA